MGIQELTILQQRLRLLRRPKYFHDFFLFHSLLHYFTMLFLNLIHDIYFASLRSVILLKPKH